MMLAQLKSSGGGGGGWVALIGFIWKLALGFCYYQTHSDEGTRLSRGKLGVYVFSGSPDMFLDWKKT